MCLGAAYPLVRPESFPNLPPQPNDYLWFIPKMSHILISWRMLLTSHGRPNDTPGVCHEHDTITSIPKNYVAKRKEVSSSQLSALSHTTNSIVRVPTGIVLVSRARLLTNIERNHHAVVAPRPMVFIPEFAGYVITPSFRSIPRDLIYPVPPHDLTDLTFYMNRTMNGPISFCYRACLCSLLNEIGDSGKPRVDFAWVGWKVRQCAGWPPSAKRARRDVG